ncbi:MAG: helix-turn-helix transcriptional regulator [Candidatus Methanomethylophilus sp.]|nr:helix-turn-helix transcriptional regulator [Methanomethylophilus sp.]
MENTMRKAPRTDRAIDVAMSVIEGRWKTFIISTLASNGAPMRFNQLISKVDGISPRIFTLQLKELESDGIILRNVRSTSPKYVEYSLTEKGESLLPILEQLADWGMKNMTGEVLAFSETVVEPDKADV